MTKRSILLLAVVALTFSCKKDESKSNEDKLVGSWSAHIQVKNNGVWPALNIDSIRQQGKVNYVFNRNYSGTTSKIDEPNGTKEIIGIDGYKWLPGGGAVTPVTYPVPGIDLTLKTRPSFWQFNSQEKKLLILDSLHVLKEIWVLDEINDHYISSVSAEMPIIYGVPGGPTSISLRLILIKK